MKHTVIDLFCGAGGLSEGFKQAGFDILAGIDNNSFAIETFKATHPSAKGICGDICEISSNDLMLLTGLRRGELTCLVGGPPCQAFSVYNHQRGMHDHRSQLFKHYLRLVDDLNPEWVVMENVLGITSVGNGQAVEEIQSSLADFGYDVTVHIVKAEEFGVPQERRRIFFIGSRTNKTISELKPLFGPETDQPFVTVWDAISDLPKLENGENKSGAKYRSAPKNEYQLSLRGNAQEVACHEAAKLGAINLERMKHIQEGGSWRDIPEELLPAGMRRAKKSDHTKRYGRLRKKGLAPTVLTKCDPHWTACIHPEQDRSLTVREAARLQSFPDHYHFCGPRTEQYVQVGNAVPPRIGFYIAKEILSSVAAPVGMNLIDEDGTLPQKKRAAN